MCLTVGVCAYDLQKNERSIDTAYRMTNINDVRKAICDLDKLLTLCYTGNYAVSDFVLDLYNAIQRAELTSKQYNAMICVCRYGYTQEEYAKIAGISRQRVSALIDAAISKIHTVYLSWEKVGKYYYEFKFSI